MPDTVLNVAPDDSWLLPGRIIVVISSTSSSMDYWFGDYVSKSVLLGS